MEQTFPVIDPVATGRNILSLRRDKGLSVRQIQAWFNFEEPRAIYKWQSGQSLPSVDNLYALSILLNVPMGDIIVGTYSMNSVFEPQGKTCGSVIFVNLLFERKHTIMQIQQFGMRLLCSLYFFYLHDFYLHEAARE